MLSSGQSISKTNRWLNLCTKYLQFSGSLGTILSIYDRVANCDNQMLYHLNQYLYFFSFGKQGTLSVCCC